MVETLNKTFVVNIHDIAPTFGSLRIIHPKEYFKRLKNELIKSSEYRVSGAVYGSDEEQRLETGKAWIGRYWIYFQVCGMFAGDEYIMFPEGTPRDLVDKSCAILVQTIAEKNINITEEERKIGNMKIVDLSEFVAERDELIELRRKRRKKLHEAMEFSKKVLRGEASYFDILRNYKRPPTLGEALLTSSTIEKNIKQFVDSLRVDDDTKYILKEYFDWRFKTTGFESLYSSFPEKIESVYKGASTAYERGFRPLIQFLGEGKEHEKKVLALKRANENRKIVDDVMKLGEELYPILNLIVERDVARLQTRYEKLEHLVEKKLRRC